ncbi:GNAT family N-acetyltransferase [Pedobacter heparinus]|uniref:GCN5-related N-acetyltransferase n=1 Tax=Pedobacter heparinus (strain ATCC 13125 / DSM 2366 / CIP 104194 / JCM 7457 / NBRC 12017 / NCIMB 9290 / NRRL B-14731 / HIM 762-3) TaxID=485917 RepID=C6XXR3_PEDHD|nr:GNAT family N-acetyltransferase [Pedobacter heparinus]ACU02317.1 GCN5-related N-acetyltransferase [Pedobacter heparinus DSM 2366]
MIILRKAKEQDIPSIQNIANKTWPEAYGDMISKEQISYMLDKMYNKGELLSQFQQGHIFLIAEEDDKDLGFAGFSVIDSKNQVYKLHKLYILPQMHGMGVGKLLINEVVNVIKKAGGKYLQLNVNRNNKAVRFYETAGFKIKETVDLDIGNGFLMNDYVMEKRL